MRLWHTIINHGFISQPIQPTSRYFTHRYLNQNSLPQLSLGNLICGAFPLEAQESELQPPFLFFYMYLPRPDPPDSYSRLGGGAGGPGGFARSARYARPPSPAAFGAE